MAITSMTITPMADFLGNFKRQAPIAFKVLLFIIRRLGTIAAMII